MSQIISPRNPRKASTYGGSRAWSEEEESFLLDSRQRKTPYKHIAQYLQKTELACRLHYHQLAYGTKRKRRGTSSSASTTFGGASNPSLPGSTREHTPRDSIDSNSSHPSLLPAPLTAPPNMSPPNSPPSSSQRPRRIRSESPPHEHHVIIPGRVGSYVPATAGIPSSEQLAHLQRLGGPLGPPIEMSRRRSSCSLESIYAHDERQRYSTPGPSGMNPRADLQFTGASSTSAPPTFNGLPEPIRIDHARLGHCYKAHRDVFWRSVARDYGGNASGAVLEAAFLRQHAVSPVSSLPTPPNRSPVLPPAATTEEVEAKKSASNVTCKVDGGKGKANCSIASILTDDQEVWSRRSQMV